MGFWIFMLLISLLFPLTMIGFGTMFEKHPPQDINGFIGYRTRRSMCNADTWAFAHGVAGRFWRIGGWILLPFSVLPLLLFFGKDTDTVGMAGSVISMLQILPLLAVIPYTEHRLKTTFDDEGRRR